MLLFATEIPLSPEVDADAVLDVARQWLAGSPHTTVPEELFPTPSDGTVETVQVDGRVVSAGLVNGAHGQTAGVRLEWVEAGEREWTAEVVGDHDGCSLWASVRLYCSVLRPSPSLPTPNKPFVVRQLLGLGAAEDGGLEVRDRPHRIPESEIGVALAAELIRGSRDNRLPVVFVSVDSADRPVLDHYRLSQWLGGIAHVVIEPSRSFSFQLQSRVGGINPYGGAVGVFWPQATGRAHRFFRRHYASSEEMMEAVSLYVRQAVAHRRPMARCSWSRLRTHVSRVALDRLRSRPAEGVGNIEAYTEAFDQENASLRDELMAAERDIARLQAEVLRAQAGATAGIVSAGEERDLYVGETSRLAAEALRAAADSAQPGTRRRDVLASLADANPGESDADTLLDEVKRVLAGYRSLGKKERNTLEKLGFCLREDGKHYKLYLGDDDRYVVTLSKTPSDGRAGLNSVSQVRRTFF